MEEPVTGDRLRWALTLAVVAAGLAALLFWWRDPAVADPAALLPADAAPERVTEDTTRIAVDVVGAVRRPGLYYLARTARVEDAIQAAGGLAPDADRESINLAERVADEQQIRVPRVGAAQPAGATASAIGADAPVDLNSADALTLAALPGIGPVMAQRIVEYRGARGPFRSVDQLLDVSGIGEATLAALRDRVVVGP